MLPVLLSRVVGENSWVALQSLYSSYMGGTRAIKPSVTLGTLVLLGRPKISSILRKVILVRFGGFMEARDRKAERNHSG